jgi:hypothetical protein
MGRIDDEDNVGGVVPVLVLGVASVMAFVNFSRCLDQQCATASFLEHSVLVELPAERFAIFGPRVHRLWPAIGYTLDEEGLFETGRFWHLEIDNSIFRLAGDARRIRVDVVALEIEEFFSCETGYLRLYVPAA